MNAATPDPDQFARRTDKRKKAINKYNARNKQKTPTSFGIRSSLMPILKESCGFPFVVFFVAMLLQFYKFLRGADLCFKSVK